MPKVNNARGRSTTAAANRHAPLGQQYANDENRSKYATVRSRSRSRGRTDTGAESRRRGDGGGDVDGVKEGDTTLLDERTSRKILELSKEQMLEVEMEEQKDGVERRRRERDGVRGGGKGEMDSSDEEGDSSSDDGDNNDVDEEEE